MKIIEMNEGTKIEHSLKSTKLTLGDAIMIALHKYQRDWPVTVDVMADANGNLVVGNNGRFYVAQIELPAIEYTETEVEQPETVSENEGADASGFGSDRPTITRTPNPLNTADVVLRLFSIDGINII